MGNPIPSQERSVDPYASYNSNVVNKLTRMLSGGVNVLLKPDPPLVQQLSTTQVRVTAGRTIMDDVLLETQSIDVDMTDADFYVDNSGGHWNETGYYYIVMCYEYQKISPPNVAMVKLILPSQRATTYMSDKHLFLSCIEIDASFQIVGIHDWDPENPSVTRRVSGTNINEVFSGDYVATNQSTSGLGDSLYDVGSGPTDRFNNIWAQQFNGSSTAAQYADLAEKYTCNPDLDIPEGTLMEMSDGDFESEPCVKVLSEHVIGILSLRAAHVMNAELKDSRIIGLVGRVPVRVIGPVKKKDILVAAGEGVARVATTDSEKRFKIAIAMEANNSDDEKLVECLIK